MAPPPSAQPPASPSGSRWIIYVILALIGLVILQKTGCGPLRTEDKTEWIDR